MHPMELLGDVGHVESLFGLFVEVFVLAQDRCTVCAKTYHRLIIVLDACDGTPR
jgi:hypothetical protein